MSLPTLMNQIKTSKDGIVSECVHLAVQLEEGEQDGARGQVAVLREDHPGQLPEGNQMLSPCFLAVDKDLETIEIPDEKASAAGRCHRELITPGRIATSRFPAGVKLSSLGALSDALTG